MTRRTKRQAAHARGGGTRRPGKKRSGPQEDAWALPAQHLPDLIVSVNREGRILAANRAVAGRTVEQTIGLDLDAHVPADQRGLLRAQLEQVFRTGRPAGYETGVDEKDTTWYETRLYPIKQDTAVVAAAVIRTDITARRQADDELRNREQEFRLTFEKAKDAIFWADAKTGRFVRCNTAAETLLERTRAEILGRPQTLIHPPDKAEYYVQMFGRHVAERNTFDDEAEVITKSGKIVPVHITASVASIGGRSIIQGIFRNITERKHMEETLRAAQYDLQKLVRKQERELGFLDKAVEASLNGIALSGPEDRLTYANPAFARLWGYENPEQVLGHNWAGFGSNPAEIRAVLQHAAQKGTWSGIVRGRRKDGSEFDAQMLIACVTDKGKPLGLAAACLDVTEERRTQQALTASERKYRQLVENTQDLVYSMDTEGRITFVGPAVDRYGYTVEEVEGKGIDQFILQEDMESVLRDVQNTLTSGTVMKTRFRMLDKTGGLHHVEELGSPIRAQSGRIVGITGVLRDVTEKIEMEEALRQTTSELLHAERLATIGQMAAGISHELNQPLTAMRTFTDNTITFLDQHQYRKVKQNLATISELIERCVGIGRQLKALAYRPAEQPVPVALATVIQEVLSFLSVRARKEGMDVTTDIPPGDCRVSGDLVRLEQVAMNLVGNAFDVMKGREQRKLSISLSSSDKSVFLRFQDTGPGIPPERRDDIFDAFVTTKGIGEGLGLGLAISARIVKEHGGTISAANAPQGGAVFTVQLPRLPAGGDDG